MHVNQPIGVKRGMRERKLSSGVKWRGALKKKKKKKKNKKKKNNKKKNKKKEKGVKQGLGVLV
jgi:hypothetical protein